MGVPGSSGTKDRHRRAPVVRRRTELHAEVIARGNFGERRIRFFPSTIFWLIERIGHVPLPPYIDREDQSRDRDRYQTVYARERGSVAAPTAGLHFTPEILARIKERGIETAEITLHVGLGTFQPVREEQVEDHRLHREAYTISKRRPNQSRQGNRTPHRGHRHHHGKDAGIFRRQIDKWQAAGGTGRGRHFYLSRLRIPRGRRHADQLSSPAIDAAHAGIAFGGKERVLEATVTRCTSNTGSIPTAIVCSWNKEDFLCASLRPQRLKS